MPKLKYSYIFNDYFNRVFECFVEVNNSINFKNLISYLKFCKGERFDEENAEYSFCWKDYYNFKMIVDKVDKQPFYRTLVHKSKYIDKVSIQISLIFNFLWESITEKTIFILELEYQDDFFTDLIKNDFTYEDMVKLCQGIEEYLSIFLKGLETYNCIYLNANIEKVRKYLLYPNLFFKIISNDIITIPKENEVSLDEIYELFAKSENPQNLIPITAYKVTNLIISSNFMKITYNTYKKISFPNIKLEFTIKELENNKCLFTINIKPNEPTTYEMNCNVYKFWKKRTIEFYHFFEKHKKKKIKSDI
jgi:hypothetical protein